MHGDTINGSHDDNIFLQKINAWVKLDTPLVNRSTRYTPFCSNIKCTMCFT